jgi:diadenosine tetraphosphate (Ap4A) HIT family hydrolase
MASVFSRIIAGELPGRFVWRDDEVVAFLSINPITHGHTLVVPRAEVDHWIDLDEATWVRVAAVARLVGQGVQRAFEPRRVGQIVEGSAVPHAHVHVLPLSGPGDLTFANAEANPDPDRLDAAARRLRRALRDLGHEAQVPPE